MVCFKTLCEPVVKDAHKQRSTGIDRTAKQIQEEWYWPCMMADIRQPVMPVRLAKHSNAVSNKNRQHLSDDRYQITETVNYLVLGRKIRMPDHLLYGPHAYEHISQKNTQQSWQIT